MQEEKKNSWSVLSSEWFIFNPQFLNVVYKKVNFYLHCRARHKEN